ncbi:MAG: FAD-dependent oxidoreductase, partial [Clostridiales bacterium]|nr:FAD-dependent oxidoreductase [Clostridiales bacterium]
RTLESYRKLSKLSHESSDDKIFAVIGGGFIGAEIAAALSMNHKKVVMLMPEEGIAARIFPHDLSQYVNEYYRGKGVDVRTGVKVTGEAFQDGRHHLQVSKGAEVVADYLVAGIGIILNVDVAQAACLRTDHGIMVDEYLATNKPGIFAAGDAAVYYSPALKKWMNFEHEDNANTMGRIAGRNMAGANEKFDHLSYFYSDLFDLAYEAVGELDSRLNTVADWAEPFKKGVIYYFKEDRICGVLLWNVWDMVPDARKLISSPGPYHPEDLDKTQPPAWKIKF